MEGFEGLSLLARDQPPLDDEGYEIIHGPDTAGPPSWNEAVVIAMTIGVFFAATTGLLRVYSRIFVVRAFRLEDHIGLASYGPYLGVIVMQALLTHRVGFLVDQWNLSYSRYLDMLLYLYVYRILYCFVMLLAKTAILVEWIHIFMPGRQRNWFFWGARTMIVLNVTAYLIAIILTSVSCVPTVKIWKPWVDGHCFDRQTTDILTAWVNLVIDLAIFLLPQPIIWKLNMTRGRKIGVSIIFSIGLVVVACATGRIHANMVLEYHGNTTYGATMNAIWAFGETSGVVIVFATPAVAKAFSRATPLGRMVNAFQSWSGLKDSEPGHSGNSKRSRLWPPTIGGVIQPRKPTDTELALQETQKGEDMATRLDSQSILLPSEATKSGITMTTNVEREEEVVSDPPTSAMLQSQHPWLRDSHAWR